MRQQFVLMIMWMHASPQAYQGCILSMRVLQIPYYDVLRALRVSNTFLYSVFLTKRICVHSVFRTTNFCVHFVFLIHACISRL